MSLETANFETADFTGATSSFRTDGLVPSSGANGVGARPFVDAKAAGAMAGRASWPAGGPPLERHGAAADRSRPLVSAAVFTASIQAFDVLTLLAGGFVASRCSAAFDSGMTVGQSVVETMIAAGFAAVVLKQTGAYRPNRLSNFRSRLRLGLLAAMTGGAATALCAALMPGSVASLELWPAFWLLIAGGLVAATTAITASLVRSPVNQDRLTQRVAVIGATGYGQKFIAQVKANADGQAAFVGLYDDDAPRRARPNQELSAIGEVPGLGSPVLGSIEDLVLRCRRERIDAIVLALPLSDHDRIARSRAALRTVTTNIYVAAEILELTCKTSQVDRIGSNPVIKVGSRPLNDWQTAQKGAMDFVLSLILIIATLPIMAIIALLIKLDSPGPVLFRQPRLGFNNNMFDVYKFRTMYHHMADLNADRQTTRGDKRITRIGRLLRKTSLDEVPQLLNVLRGDMSLVGPRPHAANTKAGEHLFHDVVADYAVRHRVKPGITGWAQVNGWRGETRTRMEIEQRVAHDFHYIDNWSLLLDIKILVLTVVRELNSKVAF